MVTTYMNLIKKYYTQLMLDRYGSRRGAVRTFWYRMKYRFGAYRNYNNVDWGNINRLVFVCKGNVCRSAYAEVIAKSLGVDAISCGIHAERTDLPANARAMEVAAKRGRDLTNHVTTPVMNVVFKKTDLVVAMEPWQADTLDSNSKQQYYTTLLGLWLAPFRPYITDPYGRSTKYFDNCFDYIEKSVYEITKKIKES